MDLIFDLADSNEDHFTDSKKDVLKFLKIIGVDTRFISYTPDKIYINNLRFSKFSRTREKTFYKQYPDIEVIRSSLFQKICSKSSKVLANSIKPNDVILLPKEENNLIEIILEPYTRKYGVKLVHEGKHDLVVNPIILDEKVNDIFSDIFSGIGLNFTEKENEIYPLINVEKNWIDSFLEIENKDEEKNLASHFMEFLEDVAPQYRENVLKAYEYIEKELKTKE